MKPEITIGILTHNRSWHFAQCLASVREFSRSPYKIKVLDTNSTENHREHMRQFTGADIDFVQHENFLSCAEGRRALLDMVDTEFVVYLDDDTRVGPGWLQCMMRQMRNYDNCAAVSANINQECEQWMSGVRFLERAPNCMRVRQYDLGYEGPGELCQGGATLYKADILRNTEFRSEFNGGYEDWDQTLQITQDLGCTIFGSRACVFHKHMPENKDYFKERWRWTELMDSALGMWDRWRVRTPVDKVLPNMIKNEIRLSDEHSKRVMEVIA